MDAPLFNSLVHDLSTTDKPHTWTKKPKLEKVYASKNHDLSANSLKGDDEKDEDSDKKKKPDSSKDRPDKNKDKPGKKIASSESNMTAVPNPLPDTTGVPPIVNVLSVLQGVPTLAPSTAKPIAVPTPLLPSLHSFVLTHPPSASPIAWATPSAAPSAAAAEQTTVTSSSHAVPAVVITLLAVGSAFLLLGIFVAFKACSRPRRRQHPTPSLPILEDDAFPERFITEGSPLFGGKERFSPRPGSHLHGTFAWTQYPHPPRQSEKGGYNSINNNPNGLTVPTRDKETYDAFTEKNWYMFASRPPPPPPPPAAPVPPIQQVLHQAASRLSTMSISLYPSSPLNTKEVGVAVGGIPSFTADGHHVIKRSQSKAALQHSRSSTAVPQETKSSRDSAYSRYSLGLTAYDGADVTSPVQSQSVPSFAPLRPAPALGGRSRIKSAYYTSGVYPSRLSAGPSTVAPLPSTATQNPFDDVVPLIVQRSASRRDRELTTALGLATPENGVTREFAPNSPQPTIYPDDSMSVLGGRSVSKRSLKKPVPKAASSQHRIPIPRSASGKMAGYRRVAPDVGDSPSSEASATLGNLMLMDFGATSKSIATLVHENAPEGSLYGSSSAPGSLASSSLTSLKNTGRKRSDDRPPRMPSPPPLPTLAQMGLEHADPEAYASYRSPTYSLYGLYDDVKSVAGGKNNGGPPYVF